MKKMLDWVTNVSCKCNKNRFNIGDIACSVKALTAHMGAWPVCTLILQREYCVTVLTVNSLEFN
jgi:hypothetical protein